MTELARLGIDRTALIKSVDLDSNDSIADKLVREAYVIGGGTAIGFANSASEAIDHPLSTAGKAASGLALAAFLTYASKGRGVLAPTIGKVLGTSLAAAFVIDLADRKRLNELGSAIAQTWQSSENVDLHRRTVSKHIGPLAFDTALFSAAGLVGTGLTSRFVLSPKTSASVRAGNIESPPASGADRIAGTAPVPVDKLPAMPAAGDRTLGGNTTSGAQLEIAAPRLTYHRTAGSFSEHEIRLHRAQCDLAALEIAEGHPNPMLAQYELAARMGKLEKYESALRAYYAHAVPTEEALALIAQHGPTIEIGAGSGYWAALLRARKTPVIAYDNRTGSTYGRDATWSEVLMGDGHAVARHPDHTLFLSWPCWDAGSTALAGYRGRRVLYLGELDAAEIMADELFFEILARDFRLVSRVDTPRLDLRVKDSLYLFERK